MWITASQKIPGLDRKFLTHLVHDMVTVTSVEDTLDQTCVDLVFQTVGSESLQTRIEERNAALICFPPIPNPTSLLPLCNKLVGFSFL